jgi:hypothetical protein
MQESDAHTGSETISYEYGIPYIPKPESYFEITAPIETRSALLSFSHEGKTAEISVKDGVVEYSGDLPVGESARLLFEALAQMGVRP